MQLIVADAGPIIHLAESDALWLLNTLGEILVPRRVASEVSSVLGDSVWQSGVEIVDIDNSMRRNAELLVSTAGLHRGEAEAIAIAMSAKDSLLLSDDAAARLYASYIHIEVRGSLGIVLAALAYGRISITEAEQMLDRLRNSSLWLSQKVFQEAIAALNEIQGP